LETLKILNHIQWRLELMDAENGFATFRFMIPGVRAPGSEAGGSTQQVYLPSAPHVWHGRIFFAY
jgi:hypothetical protein